MMAHAPDLTILVPARNEAENLPGLMEEIRSALAGRTFEVIVVDDGSSDDTAQICACQAAHFADAGAQLVCLSHARPCGKSRALASGLARACGRIIVTLDGDGQNDPRAIGPLVAALEGAAPDIVLVAARRRTRHDGLAKKMASRIANRLRQWLLRDGASDSGCGLKVIWRNQYLKLPVFDNAHRFLPALVRREGFGFLEMEIEDRPRRHGVSHYGVQDRALASLLDLPGVWWLRRRARLPGTVTQIVPEKHMARQAGLPPGGSPPRDRQ